MTDLPTFTLLLNCKHKKNPRKSLKKRSLKKRSLKKRSFPSYWSPSSLKLSKSFLMNLRKRKKKKKK